MQNVQEQKIYRKYNINKLHCIFPKYKTFKTNHNNLFRISMPWHDEIAGYFSYSRKLIDVSRQNVTNNELFLHHIHEFLLHCCN